VPPRQEAGERRKPLARGLKDRPPPVAAFGQSTQLVEKTAGAGAGQANVCVGFGGRKIVSRIT